MIANFVGDILFAGDDSLDRFVAKLDGKHRRTFGEMIRDFIDRIKGVFGKANEIDVLERKYAELFKDAKKIEARSTVKDGGEQYAYTKKRLTDNDLNDYLKAGNRANKSKSIHLKEGKKIILTTDSQISDFINKSIEGDKDLVISAYGRVSDRLANDVNQYSKGTINIQNNYLELVPEDIRHSYREHTVAKEQGDIPLTHDDYLNIPEYLDDYDELVYAIQFGSGATRICVSKKTSAGRVILIETVSKSRGAIEFKNMIGVSESKYIKEYQGRYNKRNSTSSGGSNSSNISPHNNTVSNNSIPQNSDLSTDSAKKFSDGDDTQLSYTPKRKTDVDNYTEEQYNTFGWVRANNVISAGYWKNFTENFAQAVKGNYKYPKNKNGEYMIEVYDAYDSSGITDVIVFASGAIESPNITKIVKIDLTNDIDIETKRRVLYETERRGIQQKAGEFFRLYNKTDFVGKLRQQRTGYERDGDNNGLNIKRSGSETKANRIVEFHVDEENGTVTTTYADGEVLTEKIGEDNSSYSYTPTKSETADELLRQYEDGVLSREAYLQAITKKKVKDDPVSIANMGPDDMDTTPHVQKQIGKAKGHGEPLFH